MIQILKKKFTFLVLILNVAVVSCNSQSSVGQKEDIISSTDSLINEATVFSLDNSSTQSQKMNFPFYYHDSLYQGAPFAINKNINKLFLNKPTLVIRADKNQIFYLIYPGEHIKIRINKDNEISLIIDSNIQRNNELTFFKELIKRYGKLYSVASANSFISKVNDIHSIKKAEALINNLKILRINFLDSFLMSSSLSQNFIRLSVNVIQSVAFKDSLVLYWMNKKLLTDANLYDDLLSQKLKTVKYIEFDPNPIYQNAVLTLLSLKTSPYLAFEIKSESDFKYRFDVVRKNFDGILKDFLMSHTMISAINLGIKIQDSYISAFEQCMDLSYKNNVKSSMTASKKNISIQDSDKLISANGETITDISALISKYKGKVVVLDFWASWCMPCREEFPASNSLKNHFQKDNVVFIYISQDKNVENWKKAMQQEELDINNNFLFLNAEKSIFLRENIPTIPRYMIINKDGQLVDNDSPRPSDPNLKTKIEQYLIH